MELALTPVAIENALPWPNIPFEDKEECKWCTLNAERKQKEQERFEEQERLRIESDPKLQAAELLKKDKRKPHNKPELWFDEYPNKIQEAKLGIPIMDSETVVQAAYLTYSCEELAIGSIDGVLR